MLSILIIVFLILNFLLVSLSFFTIRSVLLTETEALLGVFSSARSDYLPNIFRQYIEASSSERDVYICKGTEIINQAGYSYSTRRLLGKSISGSIIIVTSTIALLSIGILLIILCKLHTAHQQIKNLEFGNIKYKQKIIIMEDQHLNEVNQIRQYEENLYHQIKSPLTCLQLCIDQLQIDSINHNNQTHKTIQIQLRKLSRMTTLFLKDQKVTTNAVKYSFKIYSLDELLCDAIEQLSEYASYKNIVLNTHIDNSEYFLNCDQIWLQESIITLIENAIDNTHSNNCVDIMLMCESRKYRLLIRTYGTKLADEQIGQIFERYYTSSSSHFGIGLHMAKSVIESHHGQITAYNSNVLSPCVCFDVSLPTLSTSEIYNVTPL